MKTLVAGVVVALLGSPVLGVAFASPAAADAPAPPSVTTSCKTINFDVDGTYAGTGYVLAFGYGFAEYGEPEIRPDPQYQDGEPVALDLSKSYRWHLRLSGPDGSVVWDQSGTTTPCAPAVLGHAQPVRPPVPPCGSTLDDVAWPSTPGIGYSHDGSFGYAHLLPGWEWVNSTFDPGTGWWLVGSSIDSDLARLPKRELLDPLGRCSASQSPLKSGGLSGAGTPRPAATTPPTSSPPTAPPAIPTPTPAVVVATTAAPPAPSPAPSPSATSGVQATARVGTSTGLGVAGGVAGACALAAAGAFVVRRRLRPTPNDVVVLEEQLGDESVD